MPKSRVCSRLMLALAAAACLSGLLVTHAAGEEARVVKVAVEGAFPPFNFLDSNQQLQGFDVDVAKALCAEARFECQLVVQEWTAMIPNLIAGKFDAIISSMSMSAERRAKVAFTSRYYDSPTVFVKQKDLKALSGDPQELAGLTLGVTAGTAQAEYAKRFYPEVETVVFQASTDLYKGLSDKVVDVILEDKLAIFDWLTNTRAGTCCDFTGADIKDDEFFGEGAGIAVRQQDEELRQALDEALVAIKENGKYDEINAKYFPFSIQ